MAIPGGMMRQMLERAMAMRAGTPGYGQPQPAFGAPGISPGYQQFMQQYGGGGAGPTPYSGAQDYFARSMLMANPNAVVAGGSSPYQTPEGGWTRESYFGGNHQLRPQQPGTFDFFGGFGGGRGYGGGARGYGGGGGGFFGTEFGMPGPKRGTFRGPQYYPPGKQPQQPRQEQRPRMSTGVTMAPTTQTPARAAPKTHQPNLRQIKRQKERTGTFDVMT